MQTQTMKLRELTIRYAVRRDHDGAPVIVGRSLGRPSEAASALITLVQDEPSEVFAILCLTTKYQVIAYHEVGRGTLDSVLVTPRLCSAQHNPERFSVGGAAEERTHIEIHCCPN